MQDHEQIPTKKGGCLKWTCGGCVGVILLTCLLAVLLWHYLTGSDLGVSAWENLPPSTTVAMEAHDVHSILDQLLGDKGIVSLATHFIESHGGIINADTREWLAFFERMRFLAPLVLPGSVIFGLNHDHEFFLIARPPRWYQWVSDQGSGVAVESVSGFDVFLSYSDGWMVAATKRELIAEILNNWQKRLKPLGNARGTSESFVRIAGRTTGVGKEPVKESPAAQNSQPFLGLGDPFAANKANPMAKNLVWQVFVVHAASDGWQIDGNGGMVASTSETETFFNEGETRQGIANLSELPPLGTSDLLVGADISPEVMQKWLSFIQNKRLPKGIATEVQTFMRKTWLDNATGDFFALAAKPAVPPDPILPPMPVFSLGWRLADGVDRIAARDCFSRFMEDLFEFFAADGSGITRIIAANADFLPLNRREGMGKMLVLPPVVLNSAKPAWFFPSEGSPASGWIASDPAGLLKLPAFAKVGAPVAAGAFSGAAQWDMSEDFIASLWEFGCDRLATVPDGVIANKDSMLTGMEAATDIFTAFPKGSLKWHADATAEKVVFAATIPPGLKVRFAGTQYTVVR